MFVLLPSPGSNGWKLRRLTQVSDTCFCSVMLHFRKTEIQPRAILSFDSSKTGYSERRTSSLSLRPRAEANEFATSIPTFTLPSSTELMYVRWTLARSAKSSWERTSFSRAKRIARPNVRRENRVAFGTPYF
jgi:hypothetical protein